MTQLCLSHSTSPANCNYASREAGGAVGNNLSGSLVSTIGNLTNLTRLVASNNTKLV